MSLNVNFFIVITITVLVVVLVSVLAVGVHIKQVLIQVLEGFSCSLGNVTFLCAVDVVKVDIAGDAAGFEGAHVIN